jgi:HK97 family phage major capsid protein
VKKEDEQKRTFEKKGKTFLDSLKQVVDERKEDIEAFADKKTKNLVIELKAVADFSTSNVTGGSVWGAQYRPGIIENPNQIGHIRNVLPVTPAGPGTDYYFMRENGAGEGSIAPTAEKGAAAAVSQATGLKPQFDIDLIESSVKFEIIAGFMLLSRKSMKNIPGLMSFLNRRVPQKLMDVEDAQILYGNGTSPNLKGITHADNSVDSTSTATVLVEAIIDDLATLEDTYKRLADRILLRPLEYHSFFKNKASGSGEYDLPRNVTFVNGVLYIGGVPAFKTTALNSGSYIVGDFTNGAELLIQEAMKLEFFEQDSTNVRTNQVTLRVEETVALPVFSGDHFIIGTVPVES